MRQEKGNRGIEQMKKVTGGGGIASTNEETRNTRKKETNVGGSDGGRRDGRHPPHPQSVKSIRVSQGCQKQP